MSGGPSRESAAGSATGSSTERAAEERGGEVMTMPPRRGQWAGDRDGGSGRAPGCRARRFAELRQRRLELKLERLTQHQARLTTLLEFLQERAAPEQPAARRRSVQGG